MGLALYRKYRPKSLADVVGQDHIVTSLQNAIKADLISHAYLLTGPRGVGKTSIARILAHELNGLPYSDETSHLDIIEIDAASNRRIDEIRELRDKVHIAPTSAKYKVYIIDEVHMLTREAFNALLKTLEEPPEHVIFILATTEAHKVPDTITSRTQRYTFKPITTEDTAKHLQKLAEQEHIQIEDAALKLLAEHAGGSFRDSINLLDQLASQAEKITPEVMQKTLGLPGSSIVLSILDSVSNNDIVALFNAIDHARGDGVQAQLLAKYLLQDYRLRVAEKRLEATDKLLQLMDDLTKVSSSQQPYTQLELSLAKLVANTATHTTAPVTAQPIAAQQTVHTNEQNDTLPQKPAEKTPEPAKTVQRKDPPKTDESNPQPLSGDYWQDLLSQIKAKHNTLYSMLRMAQPALEQDKLVLTFNFAFHQKQISQAANTKHIADTVSTILGRPIQVVCAVGKVNPNHTTIEHVPKTPNDTPKSKPLTDVSNIFVGAELLE